MANAKTNWMKDASGTIFIPKLKPTGSTNKPIYISTSGDITECGPIESVKSNLSFGTKTYNGSTPQTITAADLGIIGAMVYKGTSSTEITDGGTQAPKIGSTTIAIADLKAGNVVLYGQKEFVWNGSKWEELGNEGSYKIKQTAVSSPSASGNASAFIDTITQNANGDITATKKNVQITVTPTVTDDNVVEASGTAGTNGFSLSVTHGKEYGASTTAKYTSGNTTTSISGSAGSGTIKIPQITVDEYGHVTSASDESVTITMPDLTPTNTDLTALKNKTQHITANADETYFAKDVKVADELITDKIKTTQAFYHFIDGSNKAIATIDANGVTSTSFNGALNGNANTATKLATARTIQTNLASTSSASFDGSGNVTPGVSGVLGIANGGTGNSAGYIRTGQKAGSTIGNYATAEGSGTTASGSSSHAEGSNTTASGDSAHAEGLATVAQGFYSHAEGRSTTASKTGSHAEGLRTTASALYSHAEGSDSIAEGDYSHAEGYTTKAAGVAAHAEGQNTIAAGNEAHAEGWQTTATGDFSHAEGAMSESIGESSHVEGALTIAHGKYSHAEGYSTITSSDYSHVEGLYNIIDNEKKYLHIVGNGTSNPDTGDSRSNAHTLDWNGNAWYQGHIYTGGTSQDDGVPIGGLVRCSYNGNAGAQTITDYLTDEIMGAKTFSNKSQASQHINNMRNQAENRKFSLYNDWLNSLKNQYGEHSIINSEFHGTIGHIKEGVYQEGTNTWVAEWNFHIGVDVVAMIGAVQQIDNIVLPDSTFLMKFLLTSSITANLLVNGSPVTMTDMDGSNIYGSDKYTFEDILLCYYNGSSVKVLNSMTSNILEISKGGTGRNTLTTSNTNYTYRASKFSTTIPTSVDKGCLVYVYAETETV